ncbi:PKD domain-containing protein [Methanolobus bombayensis]|uniref:PKD domain-containing protein n=1 Tax=Methanolobus bombayensis TaxID=38023 RepID=UPI001AE9C570|nr:PKD domain-containing protein [Methanolobus bombayensis]MBP1908861.1 PKD repeat protein [Methanolobus bombayensis]
MDRRLFLPVIVMFLSVLLLAGLINYQAGSAQESPEEVPAPVIGDKETVVQDSPKASSKEPEQVNTNTSKEEAPEPPATMFYSGGSLGTSSTEDENDGNDVKKVVEDDSDSVVTVIADFNYTVDGLNVTFTEESENASSWYWDFGDGANRTTSDNSSFVHKYSDATKYTVKMVAYGEDELNNASITKDIDLTSKSGEEENEEIGNDEEGSEERTPVTQEVPEFPTIAIPMVAIIGMAFIFSRRQ